MADNTSKSSGKNTKTLIIAIIALLLIINGVVYYMDYREKQEMKAEIATKDTELADTYRRLDEMSTELDKRIAEIESLGGNVEELERAKAELEAEKQQLQRSGEIARRRLSEVNAKVKGYEELLRDKDMEIGRLRTLSDSLYAENTSLKTTQNKLSDSVRTINQTRQELTKKVEIASRLKAENIKVAAVNKRGKEREGEFRDGQIDKLKVTFNLADNPVAPIQSKAIMLRVIDPNGNVLFDVATGSGTMMIGGREEFYTGQQEILFDNTRQQLTFIYDKGSDYDDGIYNVELYADGYMIGQEKFRVK
jgi:predicted nuclease with TOPRIM domain